MNLIGNNPASANLGLGIRSAMVALATIFLLPTPPLIICPAKGVDLFDDFVLSSLKFCEVVNHLRKSRNPRSGPL